jgi:ATP-binding cassette, subfamily B, bacterial
MSAATVLQERPVESAWRTLVRGLQLTPEFREGLTLTLLLALAATGGRVVAPIAAQLTIDALAQGDVALPRVAAYIGGGLVAVIVTSSAGYAMNYRLARATETALSDLRVRAFRHIHDLSVLHHATEHRGALVSRVTGDIDQISQFMQWGGIMLVVNLGQLVLATTVMAFYSWQLTLIVLVTFVPLVAILRWFQRRLTIAYQVVRERVGAMLSVIGESVVAAPVIRAYGIDRDASFF